MLFGMAHPPFSDTGRMGAKRSRYTRKTETGRKPILYYTSKSRIGQIFRQKTAALPRLAAKKRGMAQRNQ
jgi:hypothetical protein